MKPVAILAALILLPLAAIAQQPGYYIAEVSVAYPVKDEIVTPPPASTSFHFFTSQQYTTRFAITFNLNSQQLQLEASLYSPESDKTDSTQAPSPRILGFELRNVTALATSANIPSVAMGQVPLLIDKPQLLYSDGKNNITLLIKPATPPE